MSIQRCSNAVCWCWWRGALDVTPSGQPRPHDEVEYEAPEPIVYDDGPDEGGEAYTTWHTLARMAAEAQSDLRVCELGLSRGQLAWAHRCIDNVMVEPTETTVTQGTERGDA